MFWAGLFALICSPKKCGAQANAQLSEWPRIVPRTFTYSQVFPVGNKDFVRNAFVRVTSGPDTVLYFIDYYGNANLVKGKGGNGIYGGSGTVPSDVMATVTDRINFSGADNFGADAPFKVTSNGNEPGIVAMIANGDSVVFQRSDVEFIVDGKPGLNVGSTNGKAVLFAGKGAEVQADSFVIFTGGGQSMVIDEIGNVGIGTTNPTSDFEVKGTSIVSNLRIEDGSLDFTAGNRSLASFATNFALNQNPTGQTLLNGTSIFFRTSQVQRMSISSTLLDIDVNTRERKLSSSDYAQITSNAANIVLSDIITDNAYNAASPPASVNFVLPPSPIDGQICKLYLFASLSGLTIDPGGFALAGAPPGGAYANGSSFTFKFYNALGAWAVVDFLQR